MRRFSIACCALVVFVGCHAVRSKPDLFPPEPRVWSLVPRDATIVAALNVPEALRIGVQILSSADWDGSFGIRSVEQLRARFRDVLGIDPGYVKKAVLVVQMAVTGYYGGFLLYGVPKTLRPSRMVGRYRGAPIFRTRFLYAAVIVDAIVLGDRRFVEKVLDLRYGLGTAKTVSSSLWMHHADEIDRRFIKTVAIVADLRMLSERFSWFRQFRLNYLAGALDVERGGRVILDADRLKAMARFERKLRQALQLLRAGLSLARLSPRGISIGGGLRLTRADLATLSEILGRLHVRLDHRQLRLSLDGAMKGWARLELKAMLASLKLFERINTTP
ncbi:MAG: hypothetical protein KC609_09420 [Myxococcales bacterium]|nr:hypothetical protein [Myxococcales bacterium]